jgi:hypothetical protein
MKNSEIIRRLKKIKYKEGKRSTHVTWWNCPCSKGDHSVGVGNHPSQECWFLNSVLKDLGPHRKDF